MSEGVTFRKSAITFKIKIGWAIWPPSNWNRVNIVPKLMRIKTINHVLEYNKNGLSHCAKLHVLIHNK